MRNKKWVFLILLGIAAYGGLSRAYVTPILMYHHIDHRDQEWKLSVSPESFERQMEFLKAHQYKVLSLSEYIEMLQKKQPVPKKSVVITFDDGYDNNFINAFPVLRKMGFPATIFIQEDGINRQGYMTQDDIMILLENDIEIGSHTVHHGFLPDLSPEGRNYEIARSKTLLEQRFHRPIELFSYPGGGFNETVRQDVILAGYKGAAATHPGWGYPSADPYALKRIRVSRTADNLFVFWIQLSGFYTLIEELRG
jgi:peptidoglycan/xylan/chitin deacetylase (PgdA/CDA1 family)